MKRLDILLEQYEKEREAAKTLEQLQKAARTLVERIDRLPGEKTQIERWIRSLFAGMS